MHVPRMRLAKSAAAMDASAANKQAQRKRHASLCRVAARRSGTQQLAARSGACAASTSIQAKLNVWRNFGKRGELLFTPCEPPDLNPNPNLDPDPDSNPDAETLTLALTPPRRTTGC